MSDFLTRLVDRTQGVAQVAQPIIPPMFAPVSPTLSDYSQNPALNSEPRNALNKAMVTPPPIDSSTAMLNQSFRETSDEDFEKTPKKRKNTTKVYKEEDVKRSKSKSSDNRFAPPRHIESDLSEHVEAVRPQPINDLIEHGTIKHSSSPTSPKDLTNSKREKGNIFGNNESSTNKTVSEYNQNTSQLPEQSLGAKSGVSGRLIDPDQIRVPQNLPDAEQNQNTGTLRNQQLLNEKRDVSGGLIKSENVRVLQEMAEAEGEQNSGLQPEHSRNKKRVAPEGAIDSDQIRVPQNLPDAEQNQNTGTLRNQQLLNEKRDVSGGLIKSENVRVLQEMAEAEGEQNSGLQPEHSRNKKRVALEGAIDSDQLRVPQNLPDAERNQNTGTQRNQHLLYEKRDVSGGLIKSENVRVSQEMAEAAGDQNMGLQPEHSRNKKRGAPEGAIDSYQASALREVTESTEGQSAEISYLKRHSLGKIRFQQATEIGPSSESTIKVTIGRVEVRAIMPSVPIATASHARTRSPTLSLDDYLKRRNEGQL